MATCIHSSRSCLPPFYTIPIFPLLNRKIFHLLLLFFFFAAHCILALRNYRTSDSVTTIFAWNSNVHVYDEFSLPTQSKPPGVFLHVNVIKVQLC